MNRRRRGLQKCGTKAAKRKLKEIAGKQARFQKHTNHVISKAIVIEAQRSSRGIGLENMKHIRSRVKARRRNRNRLGNWSFGQLQEFIGYKAGLAGIPVISINPAYTSQGCSCCGLIDKRNRPDQATFSCVSCSHAEPADQNAAKNIKLLAEARLRNGVFSSAGLAA
jgi:IS605 OrfB family transposase